MSHGTFIDQSEGKPNSCAISPQCCLLPCVSARKIVGVTCCAWKNRGPQICSQKYLRQIEVFYAFLQWFCVIITFAECKFQLMVSKLSISLKGFGHFFSFICVLCTFTLFWTWVFLHAYAPFSFLSCQPRLSSCYVYSKLSLQLSARPAQSYMVIAVCRYLFYPWITSAKNTARLRVLNFVW